ncbi:class I SAM-dependent methyltransferase [Candidatus Uhrbacteria bacterium]|nr:class I SAM-dependent methyltransferase [Candidatus Uhrbacteria bacterium]
MNKEQIYAKFYDLEYRNKKDDLNFYYKLAQKIDGPILECACGAGRIIVPIAQSGKEIWGFDANAAMLNIAKNKMKKIRINKRVKIFQDDLTSFSSSLLKNKKFKFIFLPFDSLSYLAQKTEGFYSPKDVLERQFIALKKIVEHLHKDGVFSFDLFSPNDLSKEYIVRHHFSKIINDEVWNLFSSIRIPDKRVFQIHYFMEILKDNGASKRWYYPVAGYQPDFKETLLLLKRVGLRVEKIYGDFDLGPYKKNSKQMIFICRKA